LYIKSLTITSSAHQEGVNAPPSHRHGSGDNQKAPLLKVH